MICRCYAVFCVCLLATACSAPLSQPATAVQSPSGYNCPKLDDQHRAWGGVAKFAGVLAGSGGLATIPIPDDQKTLRWSVGLSAVVLGGVAAAAVYVEEDAAATWAKECSKQP